MGVMDKFLNYMKLNDDEDDEYYDDYYDDDDEVADSSKKTYQKEKELPGSSGTDELPFKKVVAKAAPARQQKKMSNNGMEVCVIKPNSVEDAREITETLLGNRTVVLNLEGLDVDIAQRIIDFTSGSCFAISGNLQKISHYIFIITPASVDISGDFQDILGNSSFDVPINNNNGF